MPRIRTSWIARKAGLELDAYLRQRMWHWTMSRNYALAADYTIRVLNRHPRDPLALVLGEVAGRQVKETVLADKCKEAAQRLCFIKDTDDVLSLLKSDTSPSREDVRLLLADIEQRAMDAMDKGAMTSGMEDERITVMESEPLAESQAAVLRCCRRASSTPLAELLHPKGSISGRGLYASQRIAPRKTILVDDPFLVQRQDEGRCSHCLSPLSHASSLQTSSGICCPHCEDETYCSNDCQEAAWSQYHASCCQSVNPELAAWCRTMTDTMYNGCASNGDSMMDAGSESRAALSCLAVAKLCMMATVKQTHPLSLNGVKGLRGTASYEPTTALSEIGSLAVALSTFLRQSQLFMEEILSLFAVLQTNEFVIPGAGIAMYPVLSMLNHSCDANCAIVGTQGVSGTQSRQLVALRDIRDGEQLFIDYNSHLTTNLAYEQRKALCGQRHFECFCSKCVRQV